MRKISANFVFCPERGIIKDGILEIDSEGKVIALRESPSGLKEESGLEFYNGILCPGFINAHCHIELSHMKGQIEEGIGLDNFIYKVVTGRHYEDEVIQKAMIRADSEMQKEGIVAVADISNREDSFMMKSSGRMYYHTFVEIFNMQNDQAKKTFDEGNRLLSLATEKYNLSASLVPHAVYSVSEELFRLFRENMKGITNIYSVHNLETKDENDFIFSRKGNLLNVFEKIGLEKGDSVPRKINAMPYLFNSLQPESRILLVHNVYITSRDFEETEADFKNTWFCLCPNSNLYIDRALPTSFLMENFVDKVCIGTDSLSSNHRLSILAELLTLDRNYPGTGLKKLLKFATLNGAEFLGIEKWAGSFASGKRPGINLIENVDLQNLKLLGESNIKKIL